MVSIEYEYMVFGAAIQNLSTASCESTSVAEYNSIKVFDIGFFSSIILNHIKFTYQR